MNDLAGRVALITGASGGVGAALAHRLHADGVKLALASRRGDDLGIEGALAAPCDVRDEAALAALAAAAVERFGGLDIVVANAGVGVYGGFLETDPEVAEEVLDVNVKGLVNTVRATLPRLLESEAAELVAVTSIAGLRGPEDEAIYAASKFAQVGFMRALDHELWAKGVRVSIHSPGGIATEFAMGRGRTPEDPDLAGFMTADEVAESIQYTLKASRRLRVFEITLLPMAEDSMG